MIRQIFFFSKPIILFYLCWIPKVNKVLGTLFYQNISKEKWYRWPVVHFSNNQLSQNMFNCSNTFITFCLEAYDKKPANFLEPNPTKHCLFQRLWVWFCMLVYTTNLNLLESIRYVTWIRVSISFLCQLVSNNALKCN